METTVLLLECSHKVGVDELYTLNLAKAKWLQQSRHIQINNGKYKGFETGGLKYNI